MDAKNKRRQFLSGLRAGIPIALGYISVSFGFGISAVSKGLSPLAAVLISVTNLTSAGQVAGLDIIVTCGGLLEMALTQLTVNLRYLVMSLSLSQKLDGKYPTADRLLTSFGITDEVFGVAASRDSSVTPPYMYGLILLPFCGWTLGTLLGALSGEVLPEGVKLALGIAIYGMFAAIIVPKAKRELGVLTAVAIAAAISCAIAYIPIFDFITSGFSIIICALSASALAALLFPIKDGTPDAQTDDLT